MTTTAIPCSRCGATPGTLVLWGEFQLCSFCDAAAQRLLAAWIDETRHVDDVGERS